MWKIGDKAILAEQDYWQHDIPLGTKVTIVSFYDHTGWRVVTSSYHSQVVKSTSLRKDITPRGNRYLDPIKD